MMRHIMGISGGKDSAALAIYLSRKTDWRYFADLMSTCGLDDEAQRIERSAIPPEFEYFFTDTGKELPEVYEYLQVLEAWLKRPVKRLQGTLKDNVQSPFDHFLIAEHGGLLPSRNQRWCTYKMKLRPMEKFVNGAQSVNYVGIRADEQARVKLSSKSNITAVYPFVQDGLVRSDIMNVLNDSTGIPKYYEWRSRSGCFFCFFQRKSEWIGLRRRHPDLFQKAMEYEENTYDPKTGRMYTWMDNMSLRELGKVADSLPPPEIVNGAAAQKNRWQEQIITENLEDDDPNDHACAICSL